MRTLLLPHEYRSMITGSVPVSWRDDTLVVSYEVGPPYASSPVTGCLRVEINAWSHRKLMWTCSSSKLNTWKRAVKWLSGWPVSIAERSQRFQSSPMTRTLPYTDQSFLRRLPYSALSLFPFIPFYIRRAHG